MLLRKGHIRLKVTAKISERVRYKVGIPLLLSRCLKEMSVIPIIQAFILATGDVRYHPPAWVGPNDERIFLQLVAVLLQPVG